MCKGQNCYLALAITVNSAIQYISVTFSYVGVPELRKPITTTAIYNNLILNIRGIKNNDINRNKLN